MKSKIFESEKYFLEYKKDLEKEFDFKEPVNLETFLVEKNGVYYTLDTTKPYSGPVFSNYKNIFKIFFF